MTRKPALGDNNYVATLEASSVLDLPTKVELGTKNIVMRENKKQERINEMCIVVVGRGGKHTKMTCRISDEYEWGEVCS